MSTLRARLSALLAPTPDSGRLVAEAPPVPLRVLFRRFWPFARPYRRLFVLGLLLLVAVAAVETAGIYLFKLVVDEVLVPQDLAPLPWVAAGYVGLTLLGGLPAVGSVA